MSEDRKTDKTEAPKGRAQKIYSVGAAIVAVGILLIQLFVPKEQLSGWSPLHILNLVLVVLAMVCAVGLAFLAFRQREKK